MAFGMILARFNPAISFNASDEEKISAQAIITSNVNLDDYPERTEVVRARFDWTGAALTAAKTARFVWTNIDTGEELYTYSMTIEKGWTNAWCLSWIGHVDYEISGPGNYSVRAYAPGLFDKTINFTVTQTPPETVTKNIIFYAADTDGNNTTAQVSVNNNDLGTTTLTQINPLLKTCYVGDIIYVSYTKDGYETVNLTKTVHVEDADPYTITAVMIPTITPPRIITATFQTNNDPATVIFDGVTHTTPYTESITSGNDHTILISKTGYDWILGGVIQTTPVTRTILANTTYTETLTPSGVTPPPPTPPPTPTGTWLDPNYWRQNYGIEMPDVPTMTLTKSFANDWGLYSYSGDGNKYIISPKGEMYVQNDVIENAFKGTLASLLNLFNIQTPGADYSGVWYDGEDNQYVWNGNNMTRVYQAGFANIGRGISKIAAWLKNTRGLPKNAFKWNKNLKTWEVVNTLAAGAYVVTSVTGAAKDALTVAMTIEGFATIAEWGGEEAVGTSSIGAFSAQRLDAETFEKAINTFDFVLTSCEEMHKITGIVPGLSPVITMYYQASRSNLNIYKRMLETKKGADDPLISYILKTPGLTSLTATVDKVVDGDTLNVTTNNIKTTVRLLAIDTPEKFSKIGITAREYMITYLEGSTITLKFDRSSLYDKYNRLLCVAYKGSECVNVEFIKLGYARVMIQGVNSEVNAIMPQLVPHLGKDFGWTAKISTLNLFGITETAKVDKLTAQKIDVPGAGTYLVTAGEKRKIVSIADRKEKDVKFTPEVPESEPGTIIIEGIANAADVVITRLDEVIVQKQAGTYEVSDFDEKKLIHVKPGRKSKTRMHPDKY